MEDVLDASLEDFEKLCQFPISFLNGDSDVASKYVDICSEFYKLGKATNKNTDNDPLSKLYIDGFDEEQIWQQIDIFNDENIKTCTKGTGICLSNRELALEEIVESDDAHDESEPSGTEDEYDEEENEEDEDVTEEKREIFEKTEVDDDFFSLRQMEKFLEAEEDHVDDKHVDEDDEGIDYFNDIPSTDDEGQLMDVDSGSEFFDDGMDDKADKTSARHLQYDDFFPGDQSENVDEVELDEKVELPEPEKVDSNFEKQQTRLNKKIKHLENRALAEADWQMKGEATADKRPVNSLLQEVLTFDHAQRAAPEITDEFTHDLEGLIRQRIKDKAWDDVERKIKEMKDPQQFKKKVVLNSEQSKLSLQEIYEKEYLAKISGEKDDDKEDPAHVEIKSLMSKLFKKLDALSNYHFHAAPPNAEIKVVTNLPSIAMEEVQPVTHTDADVLAPEEVLNKKEEKGELEKTTTDKKREIRRKKARQKSRAKARVDKLERLADTNEKLKTVQAIKKLENAAKRPGGQTTIIKSSKKGKGESMNSSKSFFGKLENDKKKATSKRKKR